MEARALRENPNLVPRRVFATILLGPFDTVYMILVDQVQKFFLASATPDHSSRSQANCCNRFTDNVTTSTVLPANWNRTLRKLHSPLVLKIYSSCHIYCTFSVLAVNIRMQQSHWKLPTSAVYKKMNCTNKK